MSLCPVWNLYWFIIFIIFKNNLASYKTIILMSFTKINYDNDWMVKNHIKFSKKNKYKFHS